MFRRIFHMTKLSWRQVLVIVGGVCLLDPCARVANAVDTDDGTGGGSDDGKEVLGWPKC